MLQIRNFDARWATQRRTRALRRGLEIAPEGLVLGAGTLLAKMARDASGRPKLLLDGEEERILALLSAAHMRSFPASVIGKIRKAADLWTQGEKALAHIHLSHTGLPPVDGEEQVFRLFAANEVLEAGLTPRTLMKALGHDTAPLDLLHKYNPDQPRVPAGSGRESGEWTSEDGGSAAGSQSRLPPNRYIEIVHHVRLVDEARPDADFHDLVSDAQIFEVPSTPIITHEIIIKNSGKARRHSSPGQGAIYRRV